MALLQYKNYSRQCFKRIVAVLLIYFQYTNGVSNVDCDFDTGNLCQWQSYDITPGNYSNSVWTLMSRPSDQPGGHYTGLERNGSVAGTPSTAADVQGLLLSPVVTTMPHSTPRLSAVRLRLSRPAQ